MSEQFNWLIARNRADQLSLPLVFALIRAGIRRDYAQKYADGVVDPKDETVKKLHVYLDKVEEKRKKFYAV